MRGCFRLSCVFAVGLLAVGLMFHSCSSRGDDGVAAETAGASADPDHRDEGEFLTRFREINGPERPRPPVSFESGHVVSKEEVVHERRDRVGGWEVQVPSKAPIATPTVVGNHLLVSGGFHSKEFYCFAADDGALLWRIGLDDDGPSSAVCEDGLVAFNTESCTVFVVDLATGEQRWSKWLGDPLTSTPAVADGRLFTDYPVAGRTDPEGPGGGPPTTHAFAAFDLASGEILWQKWIDSGVMSAPVVEGDEVLVSTFGGAIYRFDVSDGRILAASKADATSSPVVADGRVLVSRRREAQEGVYECLSIFSGPRLGSSTSNSLRRSDYLDREVQKGSRLAQEALSLDAGNGFAGGAPQAANPDAAWSNVALNNVSTMQAFQGSRVLYHRDRQFSLMGDELVCTPIDESEPSWKLALGGDLRRIGGHLGAPPAMVNGRLFLACYDGSLRVVDPDSGDEIRRWETGARIRAQPAIMHGRAYVPTTDGRVICIETGDEADTGWSTWGANGAHTNRVAGR